MLFPTLSFAVFLCLVLAGHRVLGNRSRAAWLLLTSLLFYFLWLPPYLLLLLADIGINYALLRGMLRSAHPKRWLTASIVFTIGILAGFKYLDFLAGIAAPFAQILWNTEVPLPHLLLPLGISFYSFQIIALHVDVYRGQIDAPPRLGRYALFVCFFPQLIAGPILRGSEFLPQLASGGEVSRERSRRGLWLIAIGLLKKVVLGDFLLSPMVDLSGYTVMARGIANLLGFHLPLNFEEPYLSRNPTEFWRRWHMTLSRWLRDYLYIPLGGNRQGSVRTGANLFATMLLGGLWHGAGWNFVLWGAFHGVLLALHRPRRGKTDPEAPVTWRDAGSIFLCFNAVAFLWIFFRTATFGDAATVIQSIFTGPWAGAPPTWQALLVALAAALHLAERQLRPRFDQLRSSFDSLPGAAMEGLILGAVLALVVAVSGAGGEFIYFQF